MNSATRDPWEMHGIMLSRHGASLAMKSPVKLWEWMQSRERKSLRREPAQSSVELQHPMVE